MNEQTPSTHILDENCTIKACSTCFFTIGSIETHLYRTAPCLSSDLDHVSLIDVSLAVLATYRVDPRGKLPGREAQTTLVPTRVGNADVHPDAPAVRIHLARARDEPLAPEGKVLVLNGEALDFSVAGWWLITGEVAELSLA